MYGSPALRKGLDNLRIVVHKLQGPQPTVSNSGSTTLLSYLHSHDQPTSSGTDTIVPALISYNLATKLFHLFVDTMLPEYPIVAIPESFHNIRDSKPVLFLASIAAASSTQTPALFQTLHGELVRQVTEKAILNGESSIEFIQSILILES